MHKKIQKFTLALAISITLFFWPNLEAADDGDYTHPSFSGPDKSHAAVAGPEGNNDAQAGPDQPHLANAGPDQPHLADTEREYKIPTFTGTVEALSDISILMSGKTDNILRYHNFIINKRTVVRGNLKKGATASVSYQIGKEKKINRIITTMTAVEIKVLASTTLDNDKDTH